MKILIPVLVYFSVAIPNLLASELPSYCEDDSSYRDKLQKIGPVVALGASASSGLLAKSFPALVANQMCLEKGSGFESKYSFGFGTSHSFLKDKFIEQRSKVVIAIDHLHHGIKGRRFNSATKTYIDKEIAILTLDCKHSRVDCSPTGDYHFVEQEDFQPVVLLGDIFAFYAVDCTKTDPFISDSDSNEDKGCIDDYNKINQYIWQKASETPNPFIFPVDRFYRNLHNHLPFLYNLDGNLGSFYSSDIFWDRFHPWSEPGAQILANLVLEKLNEIILKGAISSSITIPYIQIDEKYFNPFTGVVLIDDTDASGYAGTTVHFFSEQGEEFFFAFSDKTYSYRSKNGDWGYVDNFDEVAKSSSDRVGENPLVIKIEGKTGNGNIILSNKQLSVINKLSENPMNQLLGGVITTAPLSDNNAKIPDKKYYPQSKSLALRRRGVKLPNNPW